jgi:hypothetical protein
MPLPPIPSEAPLEVPESLLTMDIDFPEDITAPKAKPSPYEEVDAVPLRRASTLRAKRDRAPDPNPDGYLSMSPDQSVTVTASGYMPVNRFAIERPVTIDSVDALNVYEKVVGT